MSVLFTKVNVPSLRISAPTCAAGPRFVQQDPEFAQAAKELGVQYVGLCCGNCASFTRLVERLASGGDVVVAEGYVFEFERKGYLKAGSFVPEVVLEHPDLVRAMHEEFVHAGSDVVLAFTYYGHREKLRLIGKEHLLESLNLKALKIARAVADDTGTLMAGNICNSTVYENDNQDAIEKTEAMFKEQIEWAAKNGADYIVAETFFDLGEADLTLDCIKKYGNGLPGVVTFGCQNNDTTLDGVPIWEACRKLEERGAAVVGLNCHRGPRTQMTLMKEIRMACKGPIAALPVPFRTTPEYPTMMALKDPETGKLPHVLDTAVKCVKLSYPDPETGTRAFPENLCAHLCSRTQIEEFAQAAKELGVQYVGLCCGNCASFTRIVAETYGRKPPASKYSPDMSQHFIYGNKRSFSKYYQSSLKEALSGDME